MTILSRFCFIEKKNEISHCDKIEHPVSCELALVTLKMLEIISLEC